MAISPLPLLLHSAYCSTGLKASSISPSKPWSSMSPAPKGARDLLLRIHQAKAPSSNSISSI